MISTNAFAVLFLLSLLGNIANAAIPVKKLDGMISKGSMVGGLAGIGFSLTNLTIQKTEGGVERWVFEVADVNGQKLVGLPGYYHVELKQNPSRMFLDFAQMPKIQMSELELKKRLGQSQFVKGSELSLDPEDSSLNLSLDLKAQPKIKVYQVAGKQFTSKVVIDIRKQ